jgi:hypothetical protein
MDQEVPDAYDELRNVQLLGERRHRQLDRRAGRKCGAGLRAEPLPVPSADRGGENPREPLDGNSGRERQRRTHTSGADGLRYPFQHHRTLEPTPLIEPGAAGSCPSWIVKSLVIGLFLSARCCESRRSRPPAGWALLRDS